MYMYRQDNQFFMGKPRAQTSHLSSSLFTGEEWQALADWLELSPRETQIVQGVFDNHKENEIAGNLNLSPHTVHAYLRRVYRKLGVAGRVPLVVMVLDAHLRAEFTEVASAGGAPPAQVGPGSGAGGRVGGSRRDRRRRDRLGLN
jgi:DNA-binding CsgD family transcriptional regulator